MIEFALQRDEWSDDHVAVRPNDDFSAAITRLLVRFVARATSTGLTKGYRIHAESAQIVRGRWDIATQLRRRLDVPLPVEITYDDYTPDVLVNQILLASLDRGMTAPGIPADVRRGVSALRGRFVGVSRLTPGVPIPNVEFDRLNKHYEPAVKLASMILRGQGVGFETSGATGGSLLINMATVFESFVTRAITDAAGLVGIRVSRQHTTSFDTSGAILIRPDIVFLAGPRVIGVADTKYKVEKSGGYPNADMYQALSYAIHHQLSAAHLIYARGERTAMPYLIEHSGVTVHCHALDLDQPISDLISALSALTRRMLMAHLLPLTPSPDTDAHGSSP